MRKTHNPDADVSGIVSYLRAGRSFATTCQVFDVGEKQYHAICQMHGLTRPRSTKPRKPTTLCERPNCLKPAIEAGLCNTHKPKIGWPDSVDKPPPMKESPSALVKRVWGHRLSERDGDYFLDNRRIGFNDLMKQTNRRQLDWGMEPLLTNPAWNPVD